MRLSLHPARRSRIALTSLVDVVFILLFFFMLAAQGASGRAQRVALAAPASASTPATVADDGAASASLVLLLADGQLYHHGRVLAADAPVSSYAPQGRVTLVAGERVTVQQLHRALDRLRAQALAVNLAASP